MSGPVDRDDVPAEPVPSGTPEPPRVELLQARATEVGGLPVRRALPKRGRRTVGAWCFVDHLGPARLDERTAVEVGPHPHTGLQTVTWLVEGAQVHRDSLGSEQVIRPGQLNLMTAGAGVVHAEESLEYRGPIHGVQLWVAMPEQTRHGAADFEHHGELPQVELGAAVGTVLVGRLGEHESKARTDTPLLGLDLALRRGRTTVPLQPGYEHALLVLEGAVRVASGTGEGDVVEPGTLGYLGEGREELALEVADGARALLLGGAPFGEQLFMWWNFVARSREEVDAAQAEWEAGGERFGRVATALARVPAPRPAWRQG
jgi:redox-sensitive bicupin YhaK (pirin superfamily)